MNAAPPTAAAPARRGALHFSRTAALVLGIFLVCIETWRRSHQFGDLASWPHIFDDYLAGGFLVVASILAARDLAKGHTWLAAAWGATTMMMVKSLFVHLAERGPDPSGASTAWVLAFKGAILAVCIAALAQTLRARPFGGD